MNRAQTFLARSLLLLLFLVRRPQVVLVRNRHRRRPRRRPLFLLRVVLHRDAALAPDPPQPEHRASFLLGRFQVHLAVDDPVQIPRGVHESLRHAPDAVLERVSVVVLVAKVEVLRRARVVRDVERRVRSPVRLDLRVVPYERMSWWS